MEVTRRDITRQTAQFEAVPREGSRCVMSHRQMSGSDDLSAASPQAAMADVQIVLAIVSGTLFARRYGW
jgi:hypothetical protein